MSATGIARTVATDAPRAAPLYVASLGAGSPLVLLHGFAMHGGVLAGLAARLAARHRVHVVDLPGHGRSCSANVDTLGAVADAVATSVAAARAHDTAAHAPVAVLGWSFGGQVAMAWAAQRPAEIARLALVCTTPSFVTRADWPCAMAPETLSRFGDELAVAYRATLQRFLTLQVQGSDAGRAALAQLRARLFEHGNPAPAALARTLALVAGNDLRPLAASLYVPALVVAGARDALAPAPAGAWLAAALPAGRLAMLDGAAHAPFLSHPEAFGAALGAFLDER